MNRRRVALHLSFLSRIPNLHLCPTLFPIHYIFFMVKYNMIFYLQRRQAKYDFLKINNAIFSTLNTIIRFYGLNSTLLSIK